MGTMHFIVPEQYTAMIPPWIPLKNTLIYISGIIEITLAVLLIPVQTRPTAAKLIIILLVVFLLVIHVPQSIDYYQTNHKDFVISIIRLPIQFLLIAWVWRVTKK
jgi:uncharacterized membrane protein